MTDRPIIFSAPMIRALLDGRKTQTRRVLKPRPEYCGPGKSRDPQNWSDPESWGWEDHDAGCWRTLDERDTLIRPAFYRRDRLWVREVWGIGLSDHGDCPRYKATMDYQCGDKIKSEHEGPFKWKSPIHMPRRFSRLTLTVAEVRAQRLQEISEADAVEEGVQEKGEYLDMPRMAFRALWNSLHGPDAWGANPWVVAVSFTVRKGNIDTEGGAE